MRRLLTLTALCFSISLPTAVLAAEPDTGDAKRKINLAGKQRMLTQKMSRAACFHSLGIETAAHDAMLYDGLAEFDGVRKGLRAGSDMLGIRTEESEPVLAAIDAVDGNWSGFAAALEAPLVDGGSIDPLVELSVEALAASHGVVTALEESYSSALEVPELARLINISGRQRMLTQRAAKEFCFIAAGVNVEQNVESLNATVSLFDTSLEGLIFGDAEMGLLGAPTEELAFQLEIVLEVWQPVRAAFAKAMGGESVSEADLMFIFENIDRVTAEANSAVALYEQL